MNFMCFLNDVPWCLNWSWDRYIFHHPTRKCCVKEPSMKLYYATVSPNAVSLCARKSCYACPFPKTFLCPKLGENVLLSFVKSCFSFLLTIKVGFSCRHGSDFAELATHFFQTRTKAVSLFPKVDECFRIKKYFFQI